MVIGLLRMRPTVSASSGEDGNVIQMEWVIKTWSILASLYG